MNIHSIRAKVILITILAILTTVVSIFAVCYSVIREETVSRSVEMMNLLAQDTGKSLENYLSSIEHSVELEANLAENSLDATVLVRNGAAGEYIRPEDRSQGQNRELNEYLAVYCYRLQESFESIANRTRGAVTYYYCINPEISADEHGFFYSKVGKTGFYEREPLDARTLDPEDIEHTTWYFTPIKRGRPSWVGPYTAHFLDEMWICSYLIPVYKAGQLIGVLGMDISVNTLIDQLRLIRVYDTGYAFLLDDEGRVIYHPELEIGSELTTEDEGSDFDLMEHVVSGNEPIINTINGEKRQISFVTLSSGMKLVVTAPTREINASMISMAHISTLIAAIILFIFACIVLLAVRVITQPLKDLTDASQRLADADYDVQLDYEGRDEVGLLTGTFKQMRDQMKQYIEDLNRRIYTDSLTGLPNMRYFFELAEKEKTRLYEQGREPAIVYFNLIGMKYYNRQYGFEEGDRLICEIGQILAAHFGGLCICRFGDDRFAAVTDAEHVEEELKDIFEECRNANNGVTLPVRAGVYPCSLEDVSVSVACDRAKYASEQFRESFVSGCYFFNSDMIKEIEDVRYIINHLNQAMDERWIRVYYQPIVRAASGRICDVEALSRWIDPEKGILSPADFIPILEKARLIYKLDLYVLDRVLEKMQSQMREGITVVPHSLNLSRDDFDACDIVEEIRRRVDESGIARDRLTIEVTESMVGSDYDFMKTQIQRFQQLGFKVWMDDFGSGYSSLEVLQDIHFDLLKFDLKFVKMLDKGEESGIILTKLVQMAGELGVDTVCEGVETEENVRFLTAIGCTKLQGYYFSKPIPYEEILVHYHSGNHLGYDEE